MNGYQIAFCLFLISSITHAQEPTIVFGAAQSASGTPTEALVIEPESTTPANKKKLTDNSEQPTMPQPEKKLPETLHAQKPKEINQFAVQNPKPFSISPEKEKNQIENTLYEAGDRIYDVQSYPLKDINEITEPNIDPTITTYPEY